MVVAVDRYESAPAMQVAHRSHVIDMTDALSLRRIVDNEQPTLIVPEVEALATSALLELEREGKRVIPTAEATQLTMDREGIRQLAAEELGLKTSPYRFAGDLDAYNAAVEAIGLPCVVKPVMSSSGKGQSVVRRAEQAADAWKAAMEQGRGVGGRVIVEGLVDFEYEITLLTVQHCAGISICEPIGHRQEHGDYQESWQPQAMGAAARERAEGMARKVVQRLGGFGVFGVELFVAGDDVWFSEVSPRPHDTGMVTMISQNLSEFDLHARAILGLPIPHIEQFGPAASHVLIGQGGDSIAPTYQIDEQALSAPLTDLRLFAKPEVRGHRRLGVALARAESIDQARKKAERVAAGVTIQL